MRVYIAYFANFDHQYNLGVYRTKEGAERAIRADQAQFSYDSDYHARHNYFIEENTVEE